ncbi:MAG: hypothetical protein LLG00_01535 [Planctomycetaceae bacterium]|nr:hypothetical protein [Planctomycetaceae bacterium]
MTRIAKRLRLLAVMHYSAAGIVALVTLLPLWFFGLGLLHLFWPDRRHGDMDGAAGLILVVFAGPLVVVGWAFSICSFLVGVNLACRRRYSLCRLLSLILIFFAPIGTILGLATMVALGRPATAALFDRSPGTTSLGRPRGVRK